MALSVRRAHVWSTPSAIVVCENTIIYIIWIHLMCVMCVRETEYRWMRCTGEIYIYYMNEMYSDECDVHVRCIHIICIIRIHIMSCAQSTTMALSVRGAHVWRLTHSEPLLYVDIYTYHKYSYNMYYMHLYNMLCAEHKNGTECAWSTCVKTHSLRAIVVCGHIHSSYVLHMCGAHLVPLLYV